MQVKWAENCELLYIATVAMMSQLLSCHYDNISVMSSWPRCCSAHHLEKCFAMIPHDSLFVQLKMLKYNMDNQGTLNATHSLKTMSMFRGMLFIYFHWFWLKLMQFIIDLSSMFPVCQLKVRSTNLSQIPDLLFSSPPPNSNTILAEWRRPLPHGPLVCPIHLISAAHLILTAIHVTDDHYNRGFCLKHPWCHGNITWSSGSFD